jgi:hypothetical protein
VGALPPQCPHLAEAQEFRRRGGTNIGTAAHLNRNEGSARVSGQKIYLETPESQVAREDQPAALSKRTRRKRFGFTPDDCPLGRTDRHRPSLAWGPYYGRSRRS